MSFAHLLANQPAEDDTRVSKRYKTTKEQNRLRTEKSRATIQLNRLKRKLDSSFFNSAAEEDSAACILHDGRGEQTFVCRLQQCFLTKEFSHAQFQDGTYKNNWFTFAADRARSVLALIKGLAGTVNGILQKPAKPFHVLNCHIVDDTSIRMRGPKPATDPTTIYVIMNSVQSLHFRQRVDADNFPISLRIPTPLVVLEHADAIGIDRACISKAVVTSQGVGQLFRRFGVQEFTSQFKTYVFIGDSLRANAAAFDRERLRLIHQREIVSDPSLAGNLALKLRCSVHIVSLIRKPIVLLIPRFWTTLVRLSHLYESLTFRKQIATCLSAIICQSFVHIQTAKLPEDMGKWRAGAIQLKNSFWCQSVRKRKSLAEALDFCNGDLTGQTILHYCKFDEQGRPCCPDSKHALNKCLELLVPWFASGFPVPLLYRFKHYDHAAGFVHVGFSFHQLLSRALALVDTASAQSTSVIPADVIDKLLGNVQAHQEDALVDPAELILDVDESFQSANLKRIQLVKAEVASPAFAESTAIVNLVIQPMDGFLNRCFKRSERIAKLTHLSTLDPAHLEIATDSKRLFLEVVSGKAGWGLVDSYVKFFNEGLHTAIETGSLLPSRPVFQTVTTMVIICITDTWRRFVDDYAVFPFLLFELVGTDLPQFCKLWDQFQDIYAACRMCVDCHFSHALLSAYPANLGSKSLAEQKVVFDQVSTLLADIATFAPISSDAVEVKNGRVQWVVSKRGNQAVKAPHSARESSFLHSAIQSHELVKHFVDEKSLPSKRSIAGIVRSIRPSKPSKMQNVAWQWCFVRSYPWTIDYSSQHSTLTYQLHGATSFDRLGCNLIVAVTLVRQKNMHTTTCMLTRETGPSQKRHDAVETAQLCMGVFSFKAFHVPKVQGDSFSCKGRYSIVGIVLLIDKIITTEGVSMKCQSRQAECKLIKTTSSLGGTGFYPIVTSPCA